MKKNFNKKTQSGDAPSLSEQLATKYSLDPIFVAEIYLDMMGSTKEGEVITDAIFAKQLEWVKQNNLTNLTAYREKIKSIIAEAQIMRQMNNRPANEMESNELRKKLGMNNRDWKKTKVLEKQMGEQIKKYILALMAENITSDEPLTVDNFETNLQFLEVNKRWKETARNYFITEYPKAKNHAEIRTRILGLLEKKMKEYLEKFKDALGPFESEKITQEWMDQNPHVADQVSIGDDIKFGEEALAAFDRSLDVNQYDGPIDDAQKTE